MTGYIAGPEFIMPCCRVFARMYVYANASSVVGYVTAMLTTDLTAVLYFLTPFFVVVLGAGW